MWVTARLVTHSTPNPSLSPFQRAFLQGPRCESSVVVLASIGTDRPTLHASTLFGCMAAPCRGVSTWRYGGPTIFGRSSGFPKGPTVVRQREVVSRRAEVHLHAVRQLLQRRSGVRLGDQRGSASDRGVPGPSRRTARQNAPPSRRPPLQPHREARRRLHLLDPRKREDRMLHIPRPTAAMPHLAVLESKPQIRPHLGGHPPHQVPGHEHGGALCLRPDRNRPDEDKLVADALTSRWTDASGPGVRPWLRPDLVQRPEGGVLICIGRRWCAPNLTCCPIRRETYFDGRNFRVCV